MPDAIPPYLRNPNEAAMSIQLAPQRAERDQRENHQL